MAKAKVVTPTSDVADTSVAFIARRHVFHDGDEYFEGDEIILSESQAAPLLAVEAIAHKEVA